MPAVSSTSIAGNGRCTRTVYSWLKWILPKKKKKKKVRKAIPADEPTPMSNGTSPSSHILTKHLNHFAGGVKLHLKLGLSQRYTFPPASLPFRSCLRRQYWLVSFQLHPQPSISHPHLAPVTPATSDLPAWTSFPNTQNVVPQPAASMTPHPPFHAPTLNGNGSAKETPTSHQSPGMNRPSSSELALCPPGGLLGRRC